MKNVLIVMTGIIILNLLTMNSWSEPIFKIAYENNNKFSKVDIKQSIEVANKYWEKCLKTKENTLNKLNIIEIVWENLKEKEYAATEYSMKENQVLKATIIINKEKEITKDNLEYIITHELGHILQVNHNLREFSIMFYKPPKAMSIKNTNQEYDNEICIQNNTD